MDPIEFASRDEIMALQLRRLQRVVRHAYENVHHYRHSFESAGVHPDDLKTLEDITRFPLTTKDDLRRNYPFGMFAVPKDKLVRLHASSGTTGKPTVIGYTAEDIETWTSLMARSMRAAGVKPSDMVHIAYGYGLFTGGLGFHYGAERLGCTVVPVSGGQTQRQVQLIEDFGPDVLASTPSYALVIAEEMQRQGRNPKRGSLRVGIFGGEPWSEATRTVIEDGMAVQALDCYGISEVMGPGIAIECAEARDGLHIWEDHFLPEIIDPATGQSLPDGTQGEIVLTTLTKVGFPLIRKTGPPEEITMHIEG